jgi:hypothetical protein
LHERVDEPLHKTEMAYQYSEDDTKTGADKKTGDDTGKTRPEVNEKLTLYEKPVESLCDGPGSRHDQFLEEASLDNDPPDENHPSKGERGKENEF